MSPQILTETLFALMQEDRELLPHEIYVLSTQSGADLCKRALFQEQGGWFYKFCSDWHISGIKFDESHIYVIRDTNNVSLRDIRSDVDNQLVANQVLDLIAKFTAEKDSQLHVSIAGGRKTMGFFAGYALSMYGREQDRLSHVLVEESFEGLPEFFYPTPYPHVIRSRDKRELLECQTARVELAYIPFLAMRNVLDANILSTTSSYADKVRKLQKRVFDKKVRIHIAEKQFIIGGEQIELSAINFLFYLWIFERLLDGERYLINPFDDEPNLEYGKSFVECLDRATGEMEDHDKTRSIMLKEGMANTFIRDRRNQIHTALKKALGVNADDFMLNLVDRRKRLISIAVDADKVHII